MTSFIAAGGSGRSTSVIPAVPAAWSVTTIAFIGHFPVSVLAYTASCSHQCQWQQTPASNKLIGTSCGNPPNRRDLIETDLACLIFLVARSRLVPTRPPADGVNAG